MKRIFTLPFLLLSLTLWAQPANDNCAGIIEFGVAPYCMENVFFNNVDATASDIGFDNLPACFVGNTPQRDVWFSFIATDTILDYTVTLTGADDPATGISAISNPQIAVYRGDCEFNGLQLLDCGSATAGESSLQLDLFGLTPGITYFIRINDWSAGNPNSGSFNLCVKEIDPIVLIDQGSSTLCSGELFDTGGPDGDYGNNENNIFSICPTDLHNCINFTLEFYNFEAGLDAMFFYDGPDTNSPLIAELSGAGFDPQPAGGGGVCFSVSASSGCLTIQFTSDFSNTFEGFHGFWECTQADCNPIELVNVDSPVSEQEIIDNVTSEQTTITITDINCPDGAMGTFNAGDNSDLGLSKGIVLTSGRVLDNFFGLGINNPGGSFASTGHNAPGDEELDYLSTIQGNNQSSNDACILEMDVFAATNELSFEYVFGSEEYPEWVGSNFNDIFAFLISGPGITGDPNINDQLNIATLPDGTFVQINNVNNLGNWEYFRNNQIGQSLVYDGLTSDFLGVKKSLTARKDVIPCNTYHLKLAIADRGDFAFDSGVFISEISGGAPNLFVNFFSGIESLVENCTTIPDEVVISLNSPQFDTTTFDVIIGGTATLGEDYTLNIPSTLVFLPGETELSFPIIALGDLIPEGAETIEIMLVKDFGCGTVNLASVSIQILDGLNIQILGGQDTLFVCQGASAPLQVSGGDNYFWSPPNIFDNPNSPNPVVTPTTSSWISAVGSLGPCSDADSIWMEVVSPELAITASGPTNICVGDSISLTALNNTGNANLIWSPATGLNDPQASPVVASPEVTTIYTASIELNGCATTDSISINVDPYRFPKLTTTDTTICQNFSVLLAEDTQDSTTVYQWTPSDYLEPGPNVSGPLARPEESITYTLIATSQNNFCSDTASVHIAVLPSDVDILGEDTIELCLGESVELTALTSTGGTGLTWSPAETLSSATDTAVVATPSISTNYFATLVAGECTVVDSVFVVVDSLPDLAIAANPQKESYCEGEQVALVSPTFEPAHFPNISHFWPPQVGEQTPDSFLNMVIVALETTVYHRITVNRACMSTDSILINVTQVASLEVTPQDTLVCPGQPVPILVTTEDPISSFTWMGDGLSCLNCPNPVATPFSTTTYNVNGEFNGCPVGGSTTVNVENPPPIRFPDDNNLCNGESVLLNELAGVGTYQWTSSDGSLTTAEAQPTVEPTQSTIYTVLATSPVLGCTNEQSITINVFDPPVFQLTEVNQICPFEPVLLNLIEDTGATYQWTSTPPAFTSTAPQPTVSPGETTAYFLTVSNPGCSENASVTIEVIPRPGLNLTNTNLICPGEMVELNSVNDPNSSYQWTSSDGSLNTTAPQPIVSPSQTTTYSLVADNGFCQTDTSVTIEVVNDFTLSLTDDLTLCQGESVTLTGTLDGIDPSAVSFNWNPNVGASQSVEVSPNTTTTYVLGVNDEPLSCFGKEESVTVTVIPSISIDSIFFSDTRNDSIIGEAIEGQIIDILAFTTPGQLPGATYEWFMNGELIGTTDTPTLSSFSVPAIETDLETFDIKIKITSPEGCTTEETIVLVVNDNPVEIPNAFTPNGDQSNDVFRLVSKAPVFPLEFKIYNRWGKLIYDNEDGLGTWDGTHKGKLAPIDVYVYYITYKFSEESEEIIGPLSGEVTLLR